MTSAPAQFFHPLLALTEAQENIVTAMMLVIGAGLGALLVDYLGQRRRSGTEILTREVWLSRERRKALRNGLILVVACFEVVCVGLFFADKVGIDIVRPKQGGNFSVFTTAGLIAIAVAVLLVWFVTWLFKHLRLVRSEASLFENEQRLRVALQATNQGLYDLDLRTRESTVTPEYATLLGHDPAEFRETHASWIARLHPDDRVRVEKIFEDYIAGRIPEYRIESRQRTANGEWRWILSLGKIVQWDKNNQPVRMLGTYTDITDQKVAEHRIEEQAESLRKLSAHLVESQDAERRRVARELHDTTAQQLAALGMNLSVIEQLVGDDSAKITRLLVDSQTLVEQATQEIRTTTYLLHPPLLEAAGLAGAIQDYAEGFSRRSGLKIDVTAPADFERLPRDVELAFFRVVQESLGNVRRHSRSATATIHLEKTDGMVRLAVRDAGTGIPAEKLARMKNQTGELGVGIAGMHERLHQLDGRLEIESSAQGTTVRAIWSEAKPTSQAR